MSWDDLSRALGDFIYRHEVSGLLGAAVSSKWSPYGTSFLEVTFNLFAAWAAAVYLTEPTVSWLGLSSVKGSVYGVAFLIGLFSLNLAAALTALLKSGKILDLLPWGKK